MSWTLLLHPLWRHLPAAQRRGLYEITSAALSPKAGWTPATPRAPTAPFIVVGALSAPTGLGEAARLTLEALISENVPVSAIDLSDALMQPKVVAFPSTLPPAAGPGTILMFIQPPNVDFALLQIPRDTLRHKLRIGCWVWDLEVLPKVWRAQRRGVHELAAPSEFVRNALIDAFGAPVRLLVYPVAVRPTQAIAPRTETPTRFGALMDLGSTAARKNPLAVIAAFEQAFGAGDAAKLKLKVRDGAREAALLADIRARAGDRIEILEHDMSPEELEAWWRDVDVLVSLHRSEGFGLVLAEAMLRAIPVISTDWSSTAEFVTAQNGWPAPVTLVPAHDDTGRYELPGARWADVAPADAARLMREAAADPAERARRGASARGTILKRFSARAFLAQLGLTAKAA